MFIIIIIIIAAGEEITMSYGANESVVAKQWFG
jgi:hypothetical protein